MKKLIFLISIFLSFIFQSCFNTEKRQITASKEAQIDTTQGSCPFLTKDNKGNIVLSWIKKTDSAQSIFCYAISKDQGKTFEKTITIPGSGNIHPHGENMPKIIFKPSGEILAAWASANPNPKNDYSDIVFYTQSFDNGNTWSKIAKLVTDTAGYDQRYFDLALLTNGEVAIVWLDNRKKTKEEGSALYFAETKGNSGFTNERIIGEPCCECCRTALMVDSKNNIHVVYRAIINDSIRDMVHSVSIDNGKTFSLPERISKDGWVIRGCPHTGPAISENKNGIQFAWFTGGNDAGVYYCHSNDNGNTFSHREMISGPKARQSQIAAIGNNIATVWNESFVNKNNVYSRIGVETRNENGEKPLKQFITPETGASTFPVIKSIDSKTALIAYTENINNRDYVRYKVIGL